MRAGLARRLDRLVLASKPGRCAWAGGRCVRHAVVGDGSLDPPEPELPAICAACRRPVAWSLVVLPGVDASRI